MQAVMEVSMARNDVTVKLDARVATEAKMVAAARGQTVAEYISEILRPIVRKDLESESTKILSDSPKAALKKGGRAQN